MASPGAGWASWPSGLPFLSAPITPFTLREPSFPLSATLPASPWALGALAGRVGTLVC